MKKLAERAPPIASTEEAAMSGHLEEREEEADIPREELSAGFVKVSQKKNHTMARKQWRSATLSFLHSQRSVLHARHAPFLVLRIHQRMWWTQKLALKEERGGRQ